MRQRTRLETNKGKIDSKNIKTKDEKKAPPRFPNRRGFSCFTIYINK